MLLYISISCNSLDLKALDTFTAYSILIAIKYIMMFKKKIYIYSFIKEHMFFPVYFYNSGIYY